MRKRFLLVVAVLLLSTIFIVAVQPARADGWCVNGSSYGGGGTDHNYVEFHVNFSANNWHVHSPWWAFPIELWAYPDGNGVARAGIQGTDNDPWYSPSNYQLCGTN